MSGNIITHEDIETVAVDFRGEVAATRTIRVRFPSSFLLQHGNNRLR